MMVLLSKYFIVILVIVPTGLDKGSAKLPFYKENG